MSRIEAPCYTNGVDCPNRKVGCRKDCEAWKEYEDAVAKDRAIRVKRYNESNDVTDYMVQLAIKQKKRRGRWR